MNPGRLKDIVVIKRKTDVKDEYGSINSVWDDLHTLKAEVIYLNGKKFVNADEIFYQRTLKVTVYRRDINTTDVVEFKGDKYRIIDITPSIDLIYLTITCEKIND